MGDMVDQSLPLNKPPRRLLVVATPKSGNTWLKLLLSRLYRLPVIALPGDFLREGVADEMGESWITHEHLPHGRAVVEWCAANRVVLVSIVRHPGDVLVSLFHYMKWAPSNQSLRLFEEDGESMGKATTDYVASYRFAEALNCSTNWIEAGVPWLRYERLLANPVETLARLTDQICPLPDEWVECAVASCEIGQLRNLKGKERRHFRSGTSGQWQSEVPESVVSVLRDDDRYREFNERFGYSFALPSPPVRQFDYRSISPFSDSARFDNGVVVPAIVVQLYFDQLDYRRRWPDPLKTEGGNGFFDWLNQPLESHPVDSRPLPVVTNLANFIYGQRPDVREKYPDHLGANRKGFCYWLLKMAVIEYELPSPLLSGVATPLRSLAGGSVMEQLESELQSDHLLAGGTSGTLRGVDPESG